MSTASFLQGRRAVRTDQRDGFGEVEGAERDPVGRREVGPGVRSARGDGEQSGHSPYDELEELRDAGEQRPDDVGVVTERTGRCVAADHLEVRREAVGDRLQRKVVTELFATT